MAKRHVTVSLDEDVYEALRATYDDIEGALAECAAIWAARERRRQSIEQLDRELAVPDEAGADQLQRMDEFFGQMARSIANAYGHH